MDNSEDTHKSEMTECDEIWDELDKLFPNCPFDISCIKYIRELNDVFTTEPVIFIHDDRASPYNSYYDKMSQRERSRYVHYLKIERINNRPITLRQVIEAMVNDAHYHEEVVMTDPHRFLEGFDKCSKTGIQWSCFFGS